MLKKDHKIFKLTIKVYTKTNACMLILKSREHIFDKKKINVSKTIFVIIKYNNHNKK